MLGRHLPDIDVIGTRMVEDTYQKASQLAMQARNRGALAFADGRGAEANPYTRFEDFYCQSAWRLGWAEACARAETVRLVWAA